MSATADEPAVRPALLLEIDPDLGESLDESRRREARDRIVVPVVRLGPGAWSPQRLAAVGSRTFGLLVCEGVVVRDIEIAGSRCADLLGPGDLVAFDADGDLLLVPGDSWYVSESATVAVLDDHLLPGLRAWPSVAATLIARGARQAARSADQRAISQLPRVELRLRALLWHLSSRWGRMGVDGLVLPLILTHEALGRLIGARRPTVTLALSALARDDQVVRRPDGAWLLRTDSKPPDRLEPALGRPVDAVLLRGEPEVPSSPSPHTSAQDLDVLTRRVDRALASAAVRQRHDELMERCRTTLEASIRARTGRLSPRPRPGSPPPRRGPP